ncbi:uncharacterized protein [Channa argus]|uniref:uncharacterized protein n=1 Tax=Channa argus TaxID=215402 RepID=UPI002945F52C|nr:hypothetical protein Q8A73_004155 [Channa argus]
MFTSICVFFIALSLRTVKSDELVYSAVGDEVVLKPGPVQGPITGITWKHGQDIAIEWYQGPVEGYRQFKERGSLNVTTGALTITGLTPGESGSYTAEINNKVTGTTQLLVISRVSKPTVSTQCDADHCVFTCESNDTTAEPVTYSWMAEDKSWTSTKEISITKDESEKLFHCELRNPVSTEMSESVHNPLSNWKWYNTVLIICSTLVIGGLIFFIGFIFYKRKKRKGKWYNTVLITCLELLIGCFIFLIFLIFIIFLIRDRFKEEWYYTALIYGFILVTDVLIFVIVFIFYKRNRIKGKLRYVMLTFESLLLICLLICFIFYKRYRIKEDDWYYDALIYGSMVLNVIYILFIFYKSNERGKWYNTVLITCPALLIGCFIFLIFIIFIIFLIRDRFKDELYYTALLYGFILVTDVLILFIFIILYIKNRIKGKLRYVMLTFESLLLICLLIYFIFYKSNRIKDDWYYDVLIYGSMVLNVGLILFISYKSNERVRRVITQSLFGSLSHICCQRDADNPAPGSEPPEGSNHGPATNGPSETRPENVSEVEVSMNHVLTPTAPLENSEERESLMGSSRDPESDVPSETGRKDVSETILEVPSFQVHTNQTASEDTANETEVPGGSNQDPTSDAAPESSSETDIGASPDQVLTDATNEAGV